MDASVAPSTARVSRWGLRRRYWQLRRAIAQPAQRAVLGIRLRWLRRAAAGRPPGAGGSIWLGRWRIHYNDLASLYTQYKLIFSDRIYDFPRPPPGALVLDCGSHVGLSVLRFRQIAPDCHVVAFEPDPQVVELLRQNLADNGCGDVRVVPAALAAQAGTGTFRPDPADGGRLADLSGTQADSLQIPTVRLSDHLDEPVEFLKMNIEGAEGEVIREAAAKLHQVKRLVIEYHGFPHLRQSLHEILEVLANCGFRYAVSHADYHVNAALRPPFRITAGTRFFTWICATRSGEPRAAGREHSGAPRAARRDLDLCRPVSRQFGLDRGRPIDRYYIESFLAQHAADVRGRVLEIGDNRYTRRLGARRVAHSDVLNPTAVPGTTIVADLTEAGAIPDGQYDCILLTQTLPFIFDVAAAVCQCHRILKPDGVLLATAPGISQISRFDLERWGDFWRFTPASLRRLLEQYFAAPRVDIQVYGNVRAATAFLYGLASDELRPAELDLVDEEYPVTIAARAVRAAVPGA